ncbi:MAG: Beta-glucosidase A [candidate division WS2 bacterium ADurb.Bin280]|uniref:Beta-glucosidase A n=1 Tax=candidate division WS2 bacterium ADurb.Bin280 TaxID=1852829 RepID=A0A1V5SD34_9BACT|nr:MAG: Beta-glucosidase A [candidate division WS2 bacterium ADurb.Bin280]
MFENFPKDFFWGASTSSHQVEGGNDNNWTQFEKENAQLLADNASKTSFFLDENARQARKVENYISGDACDHYNLFENDIYLSNKLGLNAYRFSIEWSRIEPQKGMFDKEAIAHYKKMIRVLRAYKMEPFVTIWHWTLPKWFADQGAFQKRKNIKYFLRFVKKISLEMGQDVKYFITLNEPEVYSANSYFTGKWPPQKKGILNYSRVLNNLIIAHVGAYAIIKKENPSAMVGIAKNNNYFQVASKTFFNRVLKKIADKYWNDYFLKKISSFQDFIGLNYYFRNTIDGWYFRNKNSKTSDLGWDLYPEGIFNVLEDLKKYKKPIFITENGLADAKDRYRKWFINQTVKSIDKALEAGVDVRGYLHWSLLDNFEWAEGFWPRFGLIEVDYKTQKREFRPSALHYGKIISSFKRKKSLKTEK